MVLCHMCGGARSESTLMTKWLAVRHLKSDDVVCWLTTEFGSLDRLAALIRHYRLWTASRVSFDRYYAIITWKWHRIVQVQVIFVATKAFCNISQIDCDLQFVKQKPSALRIATKVTYTVAIARAQSNYCAHHNHILATGMTIPPNGIA